LFAGLVDDLLIIQAGNSISSGRGIKCRCYNEQNATNKQKPGKYLHIQEINERLKNITTCANAMKVEDGDLKFEDGLTVTDASSSDAL
jgi:hypothetical protein